MAIALAILAPLCAVLALVAMQVGSREPVPAEPARAVGGDVDRACRQLYGGRFAAVTGTAVHASRSVNRPAKGKLLREPEFGTCLVRATDHEHEPPEDFARNDYARRQAFNADESRYIVFAGGSAWHLYDGKSLAWLRQLEGPRGDAEPQWDPRDPRRLLYLDGKGGMRLHALDVETNRSRQVADFTGRLPWPRATRIWTRGEGSPSADGRIWCFLAQQDKKSLGVFSYDLSTDKIIGSHALTGNPDWVSATPSGRRCVVAGDKADGGTVAWDLGFRTPKTLYGESEHADIARGADGRDYYVVIDQQGDGELLMVDVETGKRTALLETWIGGSSSSMHISGKAFDRPGWIVLSTYNQKGGTRWLHEQVMAVELRRDPRVIRLAEHHSRFRGYWTQPHATVSRDFSRVLFNSNWGKDSERDVDAYMLRLPEGFPAAR
jgi:hypothetical protein